MGHNAVGFLTTHPVNAVKAVLVYRDEPICIKQHFSSGLVIFNATTLR